MDGDRRYREVPFCQTERPELAGGGGVSGGGALGSPVEVMVIGGSYSRVGCGVRRHEIATSASATATTTLPVVIDPRGR